MDREKEISDIKISLTNYINENIPGYEVHLFELNLKINHLKRR